VADVAAPSQFLYSSEPLALANVAALCDAVDRGAAGRTLRAYMHRQSMHKPGLASLSCGHSCDAFLRVVHGVLTFAAQAIPSQPATCAVCQPTRHCRYFLARRAVRDVTCGRPRRVQCPVILCMA